MFIEKIQKVQLDPYICELKSENLAGNYFYDITYKGTKYELDYRLEKIKDGEVVVIIMAGTRETFYHELKRYMK